MNNDRSTRFRTTHDRELSPVTLRSWERGVLCYALMMVVMMVVGVNAWGQTPDYSGTYYIASRGYDGNPNNTNNYYLCPTEGWIYYKATNNWDTDGTTYPNPFLTTYQCKKNTYHSGDPSNAVWIIEKAPAPNSDYYYIKHKSDDKYLVSNGMISGADAKRMRVHLEEVAQANLDDKALFFINTYSQNLDGAVRSYLIISPKSENGWYKNQNVDGRVQDLKYYSVNNGNQPYFDQGNGKNDGPKVDGKNQIATGGIIGVYTENDQNAQFYFEDVITRPTITYNNISNQIEITATQSGTVTIKYTTDGTTPSAVNGEEYSEPFALSEGVTTIKAITIGTDWVSNVATFTNEKRLIQSQNNAWNTTDFHFYMIPGDEASGITKVNTTSLFRSSMEWTFQSASLERGIQYYYIINNANNKYLCYDATNLVYMDDFGSGGDKFKFFMKESSRYPGTFHIIPYGQNILVSKNNGNASADAINTVGNNINSNSISENAHWQFILPTDLDKTAPFTAADATSTNYYKIASVGSSGYYIVPPSGNATNVTTSNSASDNMNWYFEVAQAATSSDWCTYYHIRNAVTGDYLYFTKDANDAGACLEMRDAIESGSSEERYKFTWARTATENTYYIIPKLVKDASQNQFSTLRRDGGNLKSNLNRGAGNYAWTFGTSSYHCIEPEVTYDDTNDKVVISSPQGVGVYYTIDGADDVVIPSSSTHYTQALEIGSTTQIIRVVCARSGDGTDNSDVVKILFNPTITLSTGAAITYDGSSHQPTISSVEYNSTDITNECTLAKYLDSNGNEVNECINAGVYTVVVTDAVGPAGENYFVYGTTTFTINKASLTITPNDGQSKGYLDSDPLLTYTASGLVTGDELTGTLSRTEGESVGTYAISQGTLNNANNTNYNISFTEGKNFTITPKSLGSGIAPATGITIDAITKSSNTYSVPGINHNGTPLTLGTEGTAYDYSRTTDDSNPKYHIVTFTGANNYSGSVSAKFVNVDFHANSDNSEWTSSFVIGSSEGAFATPTTGYSAYIVTGANGNAVTTQLLSYIPEGVPVILLANASSNGFMAQPTSGDAPDVTENKLAVSTGASFTAGQIYILYNGEFVLNAAGTLAAGKVYLPKSAITSGSAPSRLFINWGEPSGIEVPQLSNLKPQTSTGTWYTLDGRRLNSKPARKGLYLLNGQKVIVR